MRGKPAVIDDFSGGVDYVSDPRELSPNVASDLRNMVPAANGRAVRSRLTPTTLSSFSLGVGVSPVDLWFTTITNDYVLASSDRKIQSLAGNTITSRYAPAGVADDEYGWTFAQGVIAGTNYVFFMHPRLAPQFWNGAAAGTTNWTSSGSGLPTGSRAIHWRANRMWTLKDDKVWWSDLGLADTWTSTNFVQLQPGEHLYAICDCGPYIAVFSNRKCWVIYDFDTGANRLISDQHGVELPDQRYVGSGLPEEGMRFASKLAVSAGQGAYFSDGSDFYFTDGNSVEAIGAEVKSASLLASGAALRFDGRHLYYTGTLSLVYDTLLKSWWIHDAGLFGAASVHPPGQSFIASAEYNGGSPRVRAWGPEYGSTGTSIAAYWEKRGIDFGSQRRKRVRSVQVVGDSQIDAVTLRRDGTDNAVVAPTFDASGRAWIPTPGVAREWGIRVAGTDTAQWELNEFAFETQERKG